MLVNFKNMLKSSNLLNNNNNNGINLPTNGKSKSKRHFYRFMQFTKQMPKNVETCDNIISKVELSQSCLHAMHVFLHALDYAITTHLEEIKDLANYRFISKVEKGSHMKCIHEYDLILAKS